jgi:hypothetical protein
MHSGHVEFVVHLCLVLSILVDEVLFNAEMLCRQQRSSFVQPRILHALLHEPMIYCLVCFTRR